MQSLKTGLQSTPPIQLLHQGEIWLDLWEHAKQSEYSLLPAVYCLFSALELYLKAYIVLKENSFSDTNRLRDTLGHNFNSLYAEFKKHAAAKFSAQLKTQLLKYKMLDFAIDTLKYPESGRIWSIDYGLDKGDHTFGPIIEAISATVTEEPDTWIKY
jgi:hypothetical protein